MMSFVLKDRSQSLAILDWYLPNSIKESRRVGRESRTLELDESQEHRQIIYEATIKFTGSSE